MPINNVKTMALTSLPLVLLIVLTGIIIWQLTQIVPLKTGRRLSVHNALQNIPTGDIEKRLAELLPEDMFAGKDPFFRSSPPKAPNPQQNKDVAVKTDLQEIHLTTIAQGKSGRYCLINGIIYNECQSGEGFTVQQIDPHHVVFATPVQTFTLEPGKKITLEKGRILVPVKEK